MSITTSGNPVTAQQQSTTPDLKMFQMGAEGASAADSVNLFRGDVIFPLNLLSLENRGGLKTTIALSYGSAVEQAVGTINQAAPTGIVGLGWSLPFEMILLDFQGSGSPNDDSYYLANSEGGRSRLWSTGQSAVGTAEELWTFELESFHFQLISYSPAKQLWTLIEADGSTRIYGADVANGDSPNALRTAIKWGGVTGNWTGASSRTQGQESFTIAWNLAKVVNAWGDEIIYTYSAFADDEIEIGGAGGLAYTRASYLQTIADPTGRTITFNYLPKIYDLAPNQNGVMIREYEPPHSLQGSGPWPYQDRFETRFLDNITVKQTQDNVTSVITSLRFGYSVDLLADTSTIPGDQAYLYKRYLRTITAVSASGKLMPGPKFDYYTGEETAGDVHRGALKTMTQASGGTINYHYDRQAIPGTALDLTITASEPCWVSGQLRFFPGADCIVLVGYNQPASSQLTVTIYEWNGQWLSSQPIQANLPFNADLTTLQVNFGEDCFAVSVTGAQANGVVNAWAVHRVFGRYGEWQSTALSLPTVGAAGTYQLGVGNSFVVSAVAGQSTINLWTWDPRGKVWTASNYYVPTGSAGEWVLNAGVDFFTLCQYQPGQPLVLSLYYLDLATLIWCATPTVLDNIQNYFWDSKYPKLSLTSSQTVAVATFITSVDTAAKTFNYLSNTYSWDSHFVVSGAPQTVPGVNIPLNTVEPVLTAIATPTLVGNAANLSRFDGVDWITTSMGNFNQGSAVANFTYAGDLAVGVSGAQNCVAAFNPSLGQFTTLSPSVGDQGPTAPTANGNIISVRNTLFQQLNDGSLQNLGPMLGDAVVVANQATNGYLAYAQSDGSSYVLLVKNNVVEPVPVAITTGKAFVLPGVDGSNAPGMWLVGPQSFVSFVGATLDNASQFTLHRVLDQQVGGAVSNFAVTAVVALDGLGGQQAVAFDYSQGNGTVGPYGLASQYDKVIAIVGSDTITATPHGTTTNYFYNGMDSANAPADLLYSTLSGTLWKSEARDNHGTLVAQSASVYQTVQTVVDAVSGDPVPLIGSYSRVISSSETFYDVTPIALPAQPPLVSTTTLTYNEANGQPRTRQSQNIDAKTGALQTYQDAFVYAYEQYPALASAAIHTLTPSVMTTSTADGSITAIQAVTWQSWSPSGAWGPYRSFQALAATSVLVASDWANTTLPASSAWQLTSQVNARDASGDVLELIDANQLAQSVVLDRAGRFVVASFGNASVVGQQATYLGFESYENLGAWTLAGSASALMAAIVAGDASSGSNAVVMPGSGVTNSSPLATTLNVVETQGQTYIFSCWIKTASGFGSAAGSASLQIDSLASVAVPDTGGQWQLLALTANVPANASAQPLTLSLSNSKNVTLKVDDIRFSPALTAFSSKVYDPVLLTQIASMDATGMIRQSVLGDFAETSVSVQANNAPVEIKAAYLSRRGNSGSLAVSDLNSLLTLAPRDYAFYQSFNAGNVINAGWQTPTPDAWTLAGGKLNHVGTALAQIAFNGYPNVAAGATFGAALRATPGTALSAPVGLGFGSSLALTWSPLTATWVLSDTSGPLSTAPIRTLLEVASTSYLAPLNAATLPADFLTSFPLAGLPLAANSTVTVLQTGASFSITDAGSGTVYYLNQASAAASQISVSVLPRDWLLLVMGQTLAFYADGGLVLSYDSPVAIPPGLALFATDAISFDNTVFFSQPAVQIQYLDGLGRAQQEQLFDGSKLTAHATLYDHLGRGAIDTLFADVTSVAAGWGGYIADLAQFDWAAEQMSGLVVSANPDAGGYPYSRTRFEDSPMGRQVEVGLPGMEYAIVAGCAHNHTTRYCYGLNDASFTLAAGKFLRTTMVDPDGVTSLKIEDLHQQTVLTAILTTPANVTPVWGTSYNYFDTSGNPVQTITPMGWGDSYSYDFTGKPVNMMLANEGQSQLVYDSLHRLRFQLDAIGATAAAPYIRYWKYDVLSRVIEEGCAAVTSAVVAGWPQSIVANADDPTFPSANPSVLYTYDFTPASEGPLSLAALGNVTQTINSNQVVSPASPADAFSATETLLYDDRGAISQHQLSIAGAASVKTTGYLYDNLSAVSEITYPTGLVVNYQNDLLGRTVGISLGANPCAAYTYNANGELASEASYDDAGNLVGAVRLLSYESPGWQSDDAGTQFSEMTMYAPWDEGAPGYYSGAPTQIITAPRASRSELIATYELDPQGRLASVDYGSGSLPFGYDTNGNTVQMGASQIAYTAATCDRVQSRTDASGSTLYTYNPLGALSARTNSSTPAQNLSLSWDGFRKRALSIVVGGTAASQTTLALRYGFQGRRLQKTVTPAGGAATVKQYLRGAGDDSLVEITGATTVEFVRGPQGLLQIRVNNTPYFVATDRIGSIRAIVDAQGDLVGGYDFLPFGQMNGSALGTNPGITAYLFAGRELDESGLYDFRARLYDPLLGRFISTDPKHQFASPYLYAGNEPLIMVDPNGEIAFLAALGIAALIGLIVGAVSGAVSYAATHKGDFKWGDFGKAVGLGALTGAVAGAVGFAAGAAASAGAVALGYAAQSVAVGAVSGAVGGAAGGAAGQLTANAIEGRSLGDGMLAAVLIGGALGGLVGGVGAHFRTGVPRGGAVGNTLATDAAAMESVGAKGFIRYGEFMGKIPRGTPNTWAPTARIRVGYKYQFMDTNGQNWTFRLHSPDTGAPLGSVSRSNWTAKVEFLSIAGGGGAPKRLLLDTGAFHVSGGAGNGWRNVAQLPAGHIPVSLFM